MSLAILGLFKAIAPLFPTTPRRFVPPGTVGTVSPVGALTAPITARHSAAARPLRVTRLLDQGCTSTSAGRMVMSGRFEDVCAELDRLVALETAREATRTRH